MKRRLLITCSLIAFSLPAALSLLTYSARGQAPFTWPEKGKNLEVLPKDIDAAQLRSTMVGFANALGVRCVHCHEGKPETPLSEIDFASDKNPKKNVARGMIRMVASVEEQLGKLRGESAVPVAVNCYTCHRGLARPRTLADEMKHTYDSAGADSTLRLYGNLRSEYHGSGSYDFGESALNGLGHHALERKDIAGATAIFSLNLEKFPESSLSHYSRGEAHLAASDTARAVSDYETALKLDPRNRMATRRLEGLKR